MTLNIGIVGGGHAGVEAARAAAADGAARVVLFSNEPVLPYFRPRLVALAFRQAEEAAIMMHPRDWYSQKGIELRLASPAERLDAGGRMLVSLNREEIFDAIVLATGAVPVVPPFAKANPDCVTPLWNIEHARKIANRIRRGSRIVIVGGGAIGIECALRAAEAGVQATVVEKMPRLMADALTEQASEIVRLQLEQRGVRVLAQHAVAAIEKAGTDMALVKTDRSKPIEADLAILCIGAARDLALAGHARLKTDRGVCVSRSLQTSAPRVFACGDIARHEGDLRCSAVKAAAQGAVAGHNACAVVRGEELCHYDGPVPKLSLKYKDFELHCAGTPLRPGAEIEVLEDDSPSKYRAVARKEEKTVGVVMVGTGQDLRKYENDLDIGAASD